MAKESIPNSICNCECDAPVSSNETQQEGRQKARRRKKYRQRNSISNGTQTLCSTFSKKEDPIDRIRKEKQKENPAVHE